MIRFACLVAAGGMWLWTTAMAAEQAAAGPGELKVTLTPAAAGQQLVRVSLPVGRGLLVEGQTMIAVVGGKETQAAVRPLTWHPQVAQAEKSVRRALLSFPFTFADANPVEVVLKPAARQPEKPTVFPATVEVNGDTVTIAYDGGPRVKATLLGPPRASSEPPRVETVESHEYFLWQRVHLPDAQWPRVIEVRADALGLVCVVAHLQRMLEGNGRAPDFGWQIEADAADCCLCDRGTRRAIAAATLTHPFASGTPCSVTLNSDRLSLYHPTAHHKRRGGIEASCSEGKMNYRYWRCRSEEKVPMQQAAWTKAEFVVAPCGLAQLTPALEYPHDPKMDWRLWDELYATGEPLDVAAFPGCAEIVRDHHNAIVRSVCEGDDWGNITSFADDSPCGSVFGMNRLNHCPPIFEEAWRTGDRRLLDAAILWCDNFYDQSIWWGPNDTGGTRYNNILASGGTPPDNDQNYMWRSNTSVNFCTKGYDSLLMAYEQTGDPRMLEAANAQAAYAAKSVHALLETRNIGDVRDFVRLYRYTGEKRYLDESLRLFDEVRSKLSTGDLFSQSGHPLEPNPPFIEDDQVGYKHPFAKPYIIGYALAGLPDLLGIRPEEPKLKEVVKAVADFLCESQDPLGGWRYPHPRSSATMCSQAIEHAWQIVQADRALGPDEKRLDAIERVLRQRILGWQKTRRVLSGLGGWEIATGKVKATSELYGLYKYPSDRNSHRDYAEGQITFGSSPPEGLVYFTDVLRHYLKHRKAESLLAPPRDDEPLGKVLLRVPAHVSAANPEPARLPTLGFWQRDKLTLVSASFPNVPDFNCDAWCYESSLDFISASPLEGGSMELRHRLREHPAVIYVTMVTPQAQAVEFNVQAVLDTRAFPAGKMPDNLPAPNLCWQLQRAPLFCSRPDPFPEFVKRCFLFTEKGRVFLDQTNRRRIPCRKPDDPYNNPPWVQMYMAAGQTIPTVNESSWSDYSTDQYVVPVVGTVSKDNKYLAAIANNSATTMAQAWHDCMHNNPNWIPVGAPRDQQQWRLKIYVMENNPDALLARVKADFPQVPDAKPEKPSAPQEGEKQADDVSRDSYQTVGSQDGLPVFREKIFNRMSFPLSWNSGKYQDFSSWRQAARAKVMECLLPPPPAAPFDPVILSEVERGSYIARKVMLNITADSRVLCLMTIPKGQGPFPAVLLLHDHGARFDIGKEKVIEPWDVPPAKLDSARQWVQQCYGGRFLGDELAKRGYVCLAMDMFNWSDRGGAPDLNQQALAGNLLHLGMTHAGLIAHEDLRAAEFLGSQPNVDAKRVAAMGLSVGCFRTWQLAALSDHISAGVAICWMATVKGLMVPGNNQTRGQSAYVMIHPNLFNYLDYPDVASIACPKPMLFYNGLQDGLFPAESAREAHARMRAVWESQQAGDKLVTRLWDVPHVYNVEMQNEAFDWLDRQFGVSR